jgi:hypothetical protein
VQNYIDEGAMNAQSFFELDEAKLFELVHKEIDPWPRCADHFRQGFLAYLRDYRCGFAFLAEAGKQQQNPSQPLLA